MNTRYRRRAQSAFTVGIASGRLRDRARLTAQRTPGSLLLVVFAATLLLITAHALTANDTGFEVEAGIALPSDLPSWLAPALANEGYRVTGAEGPMGTFWFRSEMPERPPTGELGLDLGQFPIAALVGMIELEREWIDYRKRPIQPGRYTLRYGVQPADGDHTGQTWFRDFLMLVPLEEDTFNLDGGTEQEPVVEIAKASTSTAHPGVMAIYRIYEPVEGVAVIANDYSEPCLAIPVADIVMGLVVEGYGLELPV